MLVVDDHCDAADTLACLLPLLFDCTAHVAYSGVDALIKAELIAPQVVILDFPMPGMDGCEVARRMRERPSGRRVRIITLSWGGDDLQVCGKLAGIDVHLMKPVSADVLFDALMIGRACAP